MGEEIKKLPKFWKIVLGFAGFAILFTIGVLIYFKAVYL